MLNNVDHRFKKYQNDQLLFWNIEIMNKLFYL